MRNNNPPAPPTDAWSLMTALGNTLTYLYQQFVPGPAVVSAPNPAIDLEAFDYKSSSANASYHLQAWPPQTYWQAPSVADLNAPRPLPWLNPKRFTQNDIPTFMNRLGATRFYNHRNDAFSRLFLNAQCPDLWFSDESIRCFLEMLARQSENTLFQISSLNSEKSIPELIRSVTAKNGPNMMNGKSVASADIIFWPFNHCNHWYLLIIRKKNHHYAFQTLDGFNQHAYHDHLIERGKALMQALDSEATFAEPEKLTIPTQDNTKDCGPVICYYAQLVAQHPKLNIAKAIHACLPKQNYFPFRMTVAEQFLDYYSPKVEKRKEAVLDLDDDNVMLGPNAHQSDQHIHKKRKK